jgi:hypothetical protein
LELLVGAKALGGQVWVAIVHVGWLITEAKWVMSLLWDVIVLSIWYTGSCPWSSSLHHVIIIV